MKKGVVSCPDCGQIIRLKNTSEYLTKFNKKRNRYYCVRCYYKHKF